METRPTIVPAEISPQDQRPDPVDDAYRVERIAPATYRARYLEHRAIGATEREAADRLEALLRGEATRSEAWSRRIWTGHLLSADPVILEHRRGELAADLAEIVPLSPVEWPAVSAAWSRASSAQVWRWRIPDMIASPADLERMRSATRRGAAGALLAAAEAALVRAVWIPAALAWGLTSALGVLGLLAAGRGFWGLL